MVYNLALSKLGSVRDTFDLKGDGVWAPRLEET